MLIIFMLLTLSSFLFLIIGAYAVYRDKKTILNRIFLLLNLSFAIKAFASAFIIVAPNKEACVAWTKAMSIGFFASASLSLHFFLIYSEKKKLLKKWWTYVVLYLPVVAFWGFELSGNFYAKDYLYTKYGWVLITNSESILALTFLVLTLIYGIIGIGMAFLWWRKAKSKRAFKQGRVIIVSAFTSTALTLVLYVFSRFNDKFPSLDSIASTIWSLGILYGIVKYKFMILTPEMAAEQILETISESVIILDEEGGIISSNKETISLSGYTLDELIGKPLGTLFSEDEKFAQENLKKLFEECPIHNMETYFVPKNNQSIPVIFSASAYKSDEEGLLGYIAVARDITNLKEAEKRLHYLAHHDTLTNLPNRLLFVDRFSQDVAKAQRYKTNIAVFLLDLDHFKEVNDGYGHNVGDQLLVEVSNRLKESIRKCDSIARLGGDEFVILLSDLKHLNDFEPTANRIINSIAQPFLIEDKELHVTISVGVSMYPVNGTNLDNLLKNADMAMYSVKEGGRNNYELFTSAMGSNAEESVNLEKDLRNAMVKNELMLYYQPMVDLYSETIIGAEALIRWKHPEYGIISPADFIPKAEENGLIIPIGEWVLKTACAQAAKWQKAGVMQGYVSVNLSSLQFKQKNFVDTILNILEETKLSPQHLRLEISESMITKDGENVISALKRLNEHKILVVIAGFGTGYSSLIYLKELPIYAIKIDRFFIRNIANDPACATIIKAIISLAHDLDLKVIAEGIETTEQLEYLRRLEWKPSQPIKCDGAQGFLFSKPITVNSMTKLLNKD